MTLSKYITFIDKPSMVLSLLMLTGGDNFLILSLIAYPTSLFFLFIYWKKTIWTIIQEKFFWLYFLVIVLSLAWTADFGSSLYMTLKLIGTLLIGLSLTVRYSPKEQLSILAWTLGLCAFLSLVFGLLLPQQGIMSGSSSLQGSWSGIYKHKNILGSAMTLGTLVFFLRAIEPSKYQWIFWLGCTCSFALVILSRSKTYLVILITLLALFPLYRALRWSYSWLIPFFSIVILTTGISVLFLVTQIENILTTLGKDVTLTGRIPLWELVIAKIAERPLLGYGYGGFWLGWEGESADVWRYTNKNWEAPHSHNGFLEILLAFGLIGLVIATLTFITIFWRSLTCIRSTQSSFGYWPLWYLTLLFLSNLTESNMNAFSIYWALNIAVAISTHRKIINQDRMYLGLIK